MNLSLHVPDPLPYLVIVVLIAICVYLGLCLWVAEDRVREGWEAFERCQDALFRCEEED